MINEGIVIKLTMHAKIKINQRNIVLNDIKKVVLNPEIMEHDKYDTSLLHFIGSIEKRFLRVVGRWENKKDLLVVSAFFDRRLKKRIK